MRLPSLHGESATWFFGLLMSLLLVGCGTQHAAKVPSTAGVRGNVVTTQRELQKAQGSTGEAVKLSDSMGGKLDRAERKQVIIRRWFELQK